MISFNDILDEGTTFQGPIRVTSYSLAGIPSDVYEGDGEDIPRDEPWGDNPVSYIYYDEVNRCITIEIEEEE